EHWGIRGELENVRKGVLTKISAQATSQRADGCAAQTAHAADDHDSKRERQHLEVKPGVDAKKRPADHAAECRKKGTKGENEHRYAIGIDADAARHLRVVDGCTHRRAHTGLFHDEPQKDANGDRHADHENAIERKINATNDNALR